MSNSRRFNHKTLIVEDIENISSYEIAGLEVGDTVECSDGYFFVNYKDPAWLDIVAVSSTIVETISYGFNGETKNWEFKEHTETPVGGTSVEANPELTGEEPALEGIQIGEQKFQVASQDIISQIEMSYAEDSDTTIIHFPKGVMPLSITINTHELYLKDNSLVNELGQEVEGYEYDEYTSDGEGSLELYILGEHNEEVINSLCYISFSGNDTPRISNTYNLFYPPEPQPSGTKLYSHSIAIGADEIDCVSTRSQAYDNESLILDYNSGKLLQGSAWADNAGEQGCLMFISEAQNNTIIFGYWSVTNSQCNSISGTIDSDTVTPL